MKDIMSVDVDDESYSVYFEINLQNNSTQRRCLECEEICDEKTYQSCIIIGDVVRVDTSCLVHDEQILKIVKQYAKKILAQSIDVATDSESLLFLCTGCSIDLGREK